MSPFGKVNLASELEAGDWSLFAPEFRGKYYSEVG